MNPYYRWLKKLAGASVKVETLIGRETRKYDGKLMLTEPELALIKQKGKMYLIRTKDISNICCDKSLLNGRSVNKPNGSYSRWLKSLVNKDVRINSLDGFVYRGKVIRVEKELCVFEESGEEDKLYLFRIDQIVEVISDETSFTLRAEVEIEEIED